MSNVAAVASILGALGQSGIGDLIKGFTQQAATSDKLELRVIGILVEVMDEQGKCDIKDVIKALLEEKKLRDIDWNEGGDGG